MIPENNKRFYFFGSRLLNNRNCDVVSNVFGIGIPTAFFLCKKLGINIRERMDLHYIKFIFLIETYYVVKTKLKQYFLYKIDLKRKTKTYSGFRHLCFLPVRGQGTSTNAKKWKYYRKKNINYAITSRQLFDKYVNEIREKEIK